MIELPALISPCGRYRYWLRRDLSMTPAGKLCLFVLLNPSTADATEDDPTIRRCIGYALRWNCDALGVANLFAVRSRHTSAVYEAHDPVGGELNDDAIMEAVIAAQDSGGIIVCGWGLHGKHQDRDIAVMELLDGMPLKALHINEDGTPKHPLYCGYDLPLVEYQGRRVTA